MGSIEVLQCRACDVIVGDSSEYVAHDVDEATLTLRSAIHVLVDKKKRFEYSFNSNSKSIAQSERVCLRSLTLCVCSCSSSFQI